MTSDAKKEDEENWGCKISYVAVGFVYYLLHIVMSEDGSIAGLPPMGLLSYKQKCYVGL